MRDAGKFLRTALLIAVAVATLITARLAWAADRWVVVWAEGPDSDAIAKEVKAQLPSGLVAVDAKTFRDMLAKEGHKGPMAKALATAKTREKLFERVRKAADAAKLEAVVIIRTEKGKKGRTAQVYVVDPKSAALAREDQIALPPKKSKDDPKPVVASVAPALEQFVAPPEPAKAPEPEKTAAAEPEKGEDGGDADHEDGKDDAPRAKRPTGEVSRALVVVGAGLELGLRRFEYHDPHPLSRNLRAYSVTGAPMVAVNLELYPLADMGGPLGDIGLAGGYTRAVALQSAPQGGEKIQTTWDRWTVGLRYRLRLAGDGGPLIYLGAAYGSESFTFSGADERLAAEVPQTKYRFVRVGADARVPVAGPVAILGGASYLFTSAADEDRSTVAGRFPNASVGGVEANLGVAVGIVKGLEARLLARYTRFFYSMNPEPDALVRDTRGAPYVAGGAVDNLGSLHIGVAYAY